MSSTHYLDYLGTVWSSLPEEDQSRLGELWQGFEQVAASVFQKYLESNLNVAQQDLQAFSTERWLPYGFDDTNALSRPAVYTSSQDISLGINLTGRQYLRIGYDSQPPLEFSVAGASIENTKLSEIVAIINAQFRFAFAAAVEANSVLQLTSPTAGLSSRITVYETSSGNGNAAEFLLGIEDSTLPKTYPDYPYLFQTGYPGLASVPLLQDHVRDESVTLQLIEGTDYQVLDEGVIAFKTLPPDSMWARRSLFDQENPWNNYGFLMDIYQKNSERYVNVLQGLWFAYWTGPKPENVLRSLYLLLGLPTAVEAAQITKVTDLTIETTAADGTVRTFQIPDGLTSIVIVGQQVAQFDPLVSGIFVFDKINKPGFIASEIGRTGIQRFLTDDATRGEGDTDETRALTLLEEFTWLPQISVDAFINPDVNLGNVRTFLDAIKPLAKAYLFQIIGGDFEEELSFDEAVTIRQSIDLTESVDSNQTTYLDQATLALYETTEISGLNLDPGGVLFEETLQIDVYSFGSLIDTFSA